MTFHGVGMEFFLERHIGNSRAVGVLKPPQFKGMYEAKLEFQGIWLLLGLTGRCIMLWFQFGLNCFKASWIVPDYDYSF